MAKKGPRIQQPGKDDKWITDRKPKPNPWKNPQETPYLLRQDDYPRLPNTVCGGEKSPFAPPLSYLWSTLVSFLRGIRTFQVWGILSSSLRLFRLFSDIKGVQYRIRQENRGSGGGGGAENPLRSYKWITVLKTVIFELQHPPNVLGLACHSTSLKVWRKIRTETAVLCIHSGIALKIYLLVRLLLNFLKCLWRKRY